MVLFPAPNEFPADARHLMINMGSGLLIRRVAVAAKGTLSAAKRARANPAKVEDFGDKDLLQDIDLARILFGEVIPLRRDAR
jgi:hypothetical protein